MDWLVGYVAQAALAPILSALVSLVFFPAVVLGGFIFYRIGCGSKEKDQGTTPYPRLLRMKRTCKSSDFIFIATIIFLIGLWFYAQLTLYREIYLDEVAKREAAKDADNACGNMRHHPGRTTSYLNPGCTAAKQDLQTTDPADKAFRRWHELLYSMNLWPWGKEPTSVAVPFGIGRMLLVLVIVFFTKEWFEPAITSIKGLGNRLFRTKGPYTS